MRVIKLPEDDWKWFTGWMVALLSMMSPEDVRKDAKGDGDVFRMGTIVDIIERAPTEDNVVE